MIRLVISLTLSYLSARISQDYGLYAFAFNFILIYLILLLSNNTQIKAILSNYLELIKARQYKVFATYLIQGIILKNSNLLNIAYTFVTAYNLANYDGEDPLELIIINLINALIFAFSMIFIGTLQKTLEKLNLGSKLHG